MKQFAPLIFLLPLLCSLLMLPACQHPITPRPPTADTTNVHITAEDVRISELKIHVKASSNVIPWRLQITRSGLKISFSTPIYRSTIDTIVSDGHLYPAHAYTYVAYSYSDNVVTDSSAPLLVTTMDTTSHQFSWKKYTIGDGLGRGCLDVAIINDTCIWAVGEFYLQSEHYSTMYNAAEWNGLEWKLTKISFRLTYATTELITNQQPIVSVHKTSTNEVWYVSLTGGVTVKRDTAWRLMKIPYGNGPGTFSKIWGTDSTNVYLGGTSGRIVRFTGVSWQKLESGTTLDIHDIWGSQNSSINQTEILAVASRSYESSDRKILRISGNTVTSLDDTGIHFPLTGIWFVSGSQYYTVGDAVYTKMNVAASGYWPSFDVSQYYKTAIRGNGTDDIVVACQRGDILHFNGFTWKSYFQQTSLSSGSYNSIAMQRNIIIAVGEIDQVGAIAVGLR